MGSSSRYEIAVKMLKVLHLLSGVSRTINQLAERLNVHPKTARRYVYTLEKIMPVIVEDEYPCRYRVERAAIRRYFGF